MNSNEEPYIEEKIVKIIKKYNPRYGDNRICNCGHEYCRHFDPYENNRAVGCKYCNCFEFIEKSQQSG